MDTVGEEIDSGGKVEVVVCSNCGFKSTPLEYHAWKNIQGRPQSKRKMTYSSGRLLEDPKSNNVSMQLGDLWKTWMSIRLPLMLLVMILMMLLIITVTRG
jgi:hypothetical protein